MSQFIEMNENGTVLKNCSCPGRVALLRYPMSGACAINVYGFLIRAAFQKASVLNNQTLFTFVGQFNSFGRNFGSVTFTGPMSRLRITHLVCSHKFIITTQLTIAYTIGPSTLWGHRAVTGLGVLKQLKAPSSCKRPVAAIQGERHSEISFPFPLPHPHRKVMGSNPVTGKNFQFRIWLPASANFPISLPSIQLAC